MFATPFLYVALSLAVSTLQSSPATLGTVDFRTSCSASVATDFNHAVALLHSFEYDEARDEFVVISKKDPECAMAKWGEAMTYFHGLWGEYDPTGGSRAAKQARDIAARNPATTARERAFIAAIGEVFSAKAIKQSEREDNKPDRQGYSEPAHKAQVGYKDKMAELHRQYPDDDEATIFYALSLNVVASRADKQHPELHECTALLEPLFQRLPNHPGIAHYLVHCNDNPEMAKDGLEAARKYAQIAPASAHATHMPSHIFAQLGLWEEMVASNHASIRASEADTGASACQKTGNTLHSMYYLMFALLQEGKLQEARDVLTRAGNVTAEASEAEDCGEADGLFAAGYVLETGDWTRAKDIQFNAGPYGFDPGFMWMVKGIGAARTNDLETAKAAEAQLARMRDSETKQSHHAGTDGLGESFRLALAAWIVHASGNREEGLRLIRESADMQERLGGSFPVFKPIREMVGDMLLLDGKDKEALEAYSTVLARHPNRFNALYGAGSAAYSLGDAGTAREYYSQLVKTADGNERPELESAKKRLTESAGE